MTRHDRPRLPHVLLTDEPGVVVHNPRRHLIRILVLYAVLPLICSVAGAYVAYQLANVAMDQRVDRLEGDLRDRRAARAAEDQARDERLEQTRKDLCVVLDRVVPRDPPVEDLRRKYGCTGPPVARSPSPSPTRGGQRAEAGPAGGNAPSGRANAPRPAPAPGPPGPPAPTGPPPSPSPTGPGGGQLVCLPLLGCVL